MAENKPVSSSNNKVSISGGKQKFDPKALVAGMPKNVQKRWLTVGMLSVVAIAATATMMSTPSKPVVRTAETPSIDTTPKGISSQKDWRAQTGAEVQALKQALAESSAVQKEMLARMDALRQEVSQAKTASAAPGKAAGAGGAANPLDFNIPPPPEPPQSLKPAIQAGPGTAMPVTQGNIAAPMGAPKVEEAKRAPAKSFIPKAALEELKEAKEAEKTKVTEDMVRNERVGFLPAGSFASATMISGVEALTGGTAQSQPQPVVVRIDENAVLPNAAAYQVKGCHVLASVWGDMSSERVFGRLATLTCVDVNNKLVLSEDVEGNLIDSDGKNGVRGDLQDRQGAKLGRSLLAGFAQGLSSAFGTAQSTVSIGAAGPVTSIGGDQAAAAAAYRGASTAAQSLAQYYLKQAEATMPVIAVDAGRKISVLFTKSKPLKFESTGGYKTRPATNIKVEREVN